VLKLAFEFVVKQNKRVGVITEDVRRPGAVEQLRSLDQFLGLPVVCAESAERAREELGSMQTLDLILVDTAGRAPQSHRAWEDLTAFLEAMRPDETHLVLSAGSAERTLLDAIERYGPARWDRILLSKLDEAVSYGPILNLADRSALRLSYVTTGQEYMETLHPADKESVAQLVLGQKRLEAPHESPAACTEELAES